MVGSDVFKPSQRESKIDLPNFYDYKVTFRRDSIEARVSIRKTKNGGPKKIKLAVHPRTLEMVPSWNKYRGQILCTFHRTENGEYFSEGRIKLPESLSQDLDNLVYQAYEKLFKN